MTHTEAANYLEQIFSHVFGAGTKDGAPAGGTRIDFPATGNMGETWFIIDGERLYAISDQGFESPLARYLVVTSAQIDKIMAVVNDL